MTTLGVIWFALVGVLLTGYAIFDGFDLGVGVLYPFLGKSEEDKGVLRRSIGPVWDGNEVWLLTAGGALFAAFPAVYASVFSGFYLALMLLLFALIFRAAAIEFRTVDPAWARFWDWAFFLGSFLPALLFGVAVGNVVRGVPLNAKGDFIAGGGDVPTFAGNLLAAVNPYALVIGLLGLSWIMLQGASWLGMKTNGELYERVVKTRKTLLIVFVAMVALATAATAVLVPDAFAKVTGSPVGWLFVVLLLGSTIAAWVMGSRGADRPAFYGSSLGAVALVGIWAAAIFPNLLPSTGTGDSLSIANSSSSPLSLTVMLIIAIIGVPLVLFYFFLIYRTYAGRIDAAAVDEGAHY
jgi:cytochrome d ubiquinol oxidase subunit II